MNEQVTPTEQAFPPELAQAIRGDAQFMLEVGTHLENASTLQPLLLRAEAEQGASEITDAQLVVAQLGAEAKTFFLKRLKDLTETGLSPSQVEPFLQWCQAEPGESNPMPDSIQTLLPNWQSELVPYLEQRLNSADE